MRTTKLSSENLARRFKLSCEKVLTRIRAISYRMSSPRSNPKRLLNILKLSRLNQTTASPPAVIFLARSWKASRVRRPVSLSLFGQSMKCLHQSKNSKRFRPTSSLNFRSTVPSLTSTIISQVALTLAVFRCPPKTWPSLSPALM